MRIKIISYEPKTNESGKHDVYQYNNRNLFPFILTYTANGNTFVGEASSSSESPRWQPGEEWDAEEREDQKAIGGRRLKSFNRPQVGGTNYTSTTSFGRNTGQPQTANPENTSQTGPKQNYSEPSVSSYNNTQALIIAQSSMKVAQAYASALDPIERVKFEQDHGEDPISSFAQKIAIETVNIAKIIAPKLS